MDQNSSMTNLVQRNLFKMILEPVEFYKKGATTQTLTLYNPFVTDVFFQLFPHDDTPKYSITPIKGTIQGKKAFDIEIEHLMLKEVRSMVDAIHIGFIFNVTSAELKMMILDEVSIVVHPSKSRNTFYRNELVDVQTYTKIIKVFPEALMNKEMQLSMTNANNKVISKLFIASKDIVFYKDDVDSTVRILSIYNPLQWDIYVRIAMDTRRYAVFPTNGILRSGNVIHTQIEHLHLNDVPCEVDRITVELYLVTKKNKRLLGVIEPSISVIPKNLTKIKLTNTKDEEDDSESESETEFDKNTQFELSRRFPGLSLLAMLCHYLRLWKLFLLLNIALSIINLPIVMEFFYWIIRSSYRFFMSDLLVYYQHGSLLETFEYLSSLLNTPILAKLQFQ